MKKVLMGIVFLMMSVMSHAEMKIVVPGNGGWWAVVIPELSKALGEPITPVVIEGAKAIPAGNKFHEKFRFDNNTMWFSQGGQAEAFLIDSATTYNYKDYEPIIAHNNTILVAVQKGIDPYKLDKFKFGYSNGSNPDVMSMLMLTCGELPNMNAYLECYKKKFIYVKGISQAEIYLSFTRGELNSMRGHPSEWTKNFADKDIGFVWYSGGITNHKTGSIEPDTNFPVGKQSFEQVYKAKYGKLPKGEFYDAYVLVKSYRDVLQKVIWVNKGNPNKDRLIAAAKKMIADSESQKVIEERVGKYPWLIGDEVIQAKSQLDKKLTKKNLENLVWWTKNAYEMTAVMKPEIVSIAK